MTTVYVPSDWSQAMIEFTRRNAGRVATLGPPMAEDSETTQNTATAADPGANQPVYKLRSAAYERRDDYLQLVLDELSTGQQVQHRIEDVDDVNLLADADGRMRTLLVMHAGATTALHFQD